MDTQRQHQQDKVPNIGGGNVMVLTVIITVAVLYFARVVVVPLALAVLIFFLLGPLVGRLRRWGLGGLISTIIVVSLGFVFAVALAGLMALQVSDLAKKLPEYRQNVREKMADIRSSGGGIVTRVTGIVHTLSSDLVPKAAKEPAGPPEEKPVPVEMREAPFSPMELFQKILGSLLEFGVTAGIVPRNGEEILCLPARDEADELAAAMLAQLLRQRGLSARAMPAGSLAGESLQEVSRSEARVACVAAVPPFGYMHARYLCRRLRAHNPQIKVVAAFLTEGDVNEIRRREPSLCADEIASNPSQSIAAVIALVTSSASSTPAAAPQTAQT